MKRNTQGQLKDVIKQEYVKCAADPVYFLKKYCLIQHPIKGKIPFHLYDFQEKTVEDFVSSYFMNYLSLEMSEGMTMDANAGKKLLSGLSSEQLPISCSYKYTNNGTSAYAWAKNVNVMSLTTRLLVIENGQSCYVEI